MADGFITWGFDEKRYRYTFTDVERRMRVINKKTTTKQNHQRKKINNN